MGDCDLAEIKQKFGHKLALMGNLHTTNVMLRGSTEDVRREALKAILAAGQNGGFVLSTGDQCGRDTPFENIFEIVKVAKEFGAYPLDIGHIREEIAGLDQGRWGLIFGSFTPILLQIMQYLVKQKDRKPSHLPVFLLYYRYIWRPRGDSNARPLAPQASALIH